ncbi:hypothetical protein WA026_019836 [Henosepilachna vigintioctopunctata]|uniref:Uncharacterized protein n=1 Tax=Henosepilachna vigintioctopunctata TaxID=420089 RepID=A0AAW1VAI0_9CUCU
MITKIELHLFICFIISVTGLTVPDDQKILRQCASTTDLRMDEWLEYLDTRNASEKTLCTLKCMHEKEGSLGENGEWNIKFIEKKLSSMLMVQNSMKKQILDCVSNLPPIQKCVGILEIDKCITNIKVRNCSGEFYISQGDYKEYRKDFRNPSERMMCFLKCTAERDDVISSSGKTNIQLLNKIVDSGTFMSEEMKLKVKKCFSEVPEIKSCSDYKPFHICTLGMKM